MKAWLMASRWRVLLVALAVLLLLDTGRSIYARLAYAQATETWQGEPYQDLSWPPGADLPADTPLGQRVFIERCAVCHGPEGQGNGPAAPSMIPRPRDFTLGQFKYKTTPAGQPPSDEDLLRVVSNGLPASAMPYFGDILSETELTAVIAYIKSLSPVFDQGGATAITVPPRIEPDEASRERGEALYGRLGCAACHGPDGRGGITLADAKGYPIISRDLTAPWTFRGGSDPEQIWLRLTTGLAPGPMPSFADQTTAEERWDLVNYLLSLSRPAPWETGGRLDGPGQHPDPVRRGEYIVHAEMCGLCHTQINPSGIYRGDDYYLAGGMRVDAYPQGVFVTRNLTGDPVTGLGDWTTEEVADAIRNGRAPGRLLNLWGMPWIFLHNFTEEDALAVAAYLKSQTAVTNEIPPVLHYGLLETIIAKTAYSNSLPPIGGPERLTYVDGNFGQPSPGILPRGWLQSVLIAGQWLVLAAGLVGFVLATPAEQRLPHGRKGWLKAVLGLVALAILWLLGSTMYNTPKLGFIPPDLIAQGALMGIPEVDTTTFNTPEEAALAERGRYLFQTASCAFCHGNGGEGGAKLSWQYAGTLWTRNITSDPATGLGNWSDEEIARAIRSGISADGRPLHWQGMIWDHASNWDEEDIRALVAYLRVLPPVVNEVPMALPPSPADCEEYTFFLVDSLIPGCEVE
jgi:mono/diheme cytochrome c family protein